MSKQETPLNFSRNSLNYCEYNASFLAVSRLDANRYQEITSLVASSHWSSVFLTSSVASHIGGVCSTIYSGEVLSTSCITYNKKETSVEKGIGSR